MPSLPEGCFHRTRGTAGSMEEGTWEAVELWGVKKAEASSKWVPAWARVCLSCPSEVGANILNGFEWFRMFSLPTHGLMTENPLGEVQSRNQPEIHCHILEQRVDNPVQLLVSERRPRQGLRSARGRRVKERPSCARPPSLGHTAPRPSLGRRLPCAFGLPARRGHLPFEECLENYLGRNRELHFLQKGNNRWFICQ